MCSCTKFETGRKNSEKSTPIPAKHKRLWENEDCAYSLLLTHLEHNACDREADNVVLDGCRGRWIYYHSCPAQMYPYVSAEFAMSCQTQD